MVANPVAGDCQVSGRIAVVDFNLAASTLAGFSGLSRGEDSNASARGADFGVGIDLGDDVPGPVLDLSRFWVSALVQVDADEVILQDDPNPATSSSSSRYSTASAKEDQLAGLVVLAVVPSGDTGILVGFGPPLSTSFQHTHWFRAFNSDGIHSSLGFR